MRKAAHWSGVFATLQSLVDYQATDNSKESLAVKRKEKRIMKNSDMPPSTAQTPPTRVGPSAPQQTEEETRRVTSISDPEKSSAGYKLYHACDERESEALGNQFASMALMALFEEKPHVSWVSGRPKAPIVQWRSRYTLHRISLLAYRLVPWQRK
jgi:hypothetical protein